MTRFYKFIEYGYLIIAVFLLVETVLNWSSDRQKAYFYLGFSILAILMFFFKKNFRKRIENRKNNQ